MRMGEYVLFRLRRGQLEAEIRRLKSGCLGRVFDWGSFKVYVFEFVEFVEFVDGG